MTPVPDPRTLYAERLAERQALAEACVRTSDRYSNGRLAVFTVCVAVGFACWYGDLPWLVFPFPVALFVVLVVRHDRVEKALARHRAVIEEYQWGLARLEGRWQGLGPEGTGFAAPDHPYAADLDLLGKGSLFQLLCTARTPFGQRVLAEWLLQPASPPEVEARREASRELTTRFTLREDLAALAPTATATHREARLAAWGLGESRFLSPTLGIIAWTLAAAAVAGLILLVAAGVAALLVFVLALGIGLFAWYRGPLLQLGESLDGLSRELNTLSVLLARFETETCTAPLLAAQQERLRAHGRPASEAIARLDMLVNLYNLQRNPMFAPIGLCTAWSLHTARALERWRERHGRDLAGWLDALGTWEALAALGTYRFEHPEDADPEIAEGESRFTAKGLGHPLLDAGQCVRNDVDLGRSPQVLMVSGSNMSGKSTLLRSVGLAAVMAQTGAPVRAKALAMSPLQIGAALRVQDSLLEGASRFYAELRRLQQIMEMADGTPPLLFLCDEILHGTNSKDRCVGAAALIRAFRERGAIGLVTTHDLALTEATAESDGAVVNVHFQDRHGDGALAFDYRLRPGVVQHSNALALMRSLGLPV